MSHEEVNPSENSDPIPMEPVGQEDEPKIVQRGAVNKGLIIKNNSEVEDPRRSLGYTKEFKNFIKEHPHAIAIALRLIEKIKYEIERIMKEGGADAVSGFERIDRRAAATKEVEGQELEDGPVTVKLVPRRQETWGNNPIFKVDIDGKSFAVKLGSGGSVEGGGRKEFEDTIKAKEILEDLPWAEVANFQLGYTQGVGKKYYIAEWIEGAELLQDYLKKLSASDPKYKELNERVNIIKSRLGEDRYNYGDVGGKNMFYDEQRDKIIVFDLSADWPKSPLDFLF